MHNVLAVLAIFISCYFLIHLLKSSGITETILTAFLLISAQIVIMGYLLSFINRLNDIRFWVLLGFTSNLIVSIFFLLIKRPSGLPRLHFSQLKSIKLSIKKWITEETSSFEKLLLIPPLFTGLLLGLINLRVILTTKPHNTDSMTYHLARVAYYLQQSNFNYFEANYWAQVIHPKNSALLLLYTYLVSGRNENATQLVQFIAYWVAVCSVYAISRKTGNNKIQSLFAASVSALLIEWLMQSTTTQNDMVLAAYSGAIVYFILAFKKMQRPTHLFLASLGMGLSIGTKSSSFLTLLPIGLLTFYAIFSGMLRSQLRNFVILAISGLFAFSIFALPAGYIENLRNFGHPLGPEDVRKSHSFEGQPIGFIAWNGTLNILRYGFEFLTLDGLPPSSMVSKAQTLIFFFPEMIVRKLEINLEKFEAMRAPFSYALINEPKAQEDFSYWGILGFGLVWITTAFSIFGQVKSTESRILSIAGVLFFFLQAYVGPYDPWRGRYFTACAIFTVPSVSMALQARKKPFRLYLLMIILLGCLSAVFAIGLRCNSALIPTSFHGCHPKSVNRMNRLEQLTRNRPILYKPVKAFDQMVPKDATVAVFLYGDSYEYPLFGKYMTRTIIPINSFAKGLQPIPAQAEYLLYTTGFPCADSKDTSLGADWFLRELSDQNRKCP